MSQNKITSRYVTTHDGSLYNGILESDFKDGVCVWSCSRLGDGKHVGFVAQETYGLTSNLCKSCEAARAEMLNTLHSKALQNQK